MFAFERRHRTHQERHHNALRVRHRRALRIHLGYLRDRPAEESVRVPRLELVRVDHEAPDVGDAVARRRGRERERRAAGGRSVRGRAHCAEGCEPARRAPADDDARRIDEVVRRVCDDLRGLDAVPDVDDAPLPREALDIRCPRLRTTVSRYG